MQVIDEMIQHAEYRGLVKGFMVESFIKSGNQNAEMANPIDMDGLSITDPCIGWADTEELLLKLANRVRKGY